MRYGNIIRWSVSLALLAFVVLRLAGDWHRVGAATLDVRWGWIVGATLLVAIEFLIAVEIWRTSLRWLQVPLPYPLAFHIMGVSNLAKYLPGGIWNFIGRAAMCQRQQFPAAPVLESLLVEVVVQMGANAVIGAVALAAIGSTPQAAVPTWTLAFAVAPLIALHPGIINSLLNHGSRLLRRELPRVRLRYAQVLAIYAVSILNWALLGLAFTAFGQGILVRPLSVDETLALVGATNAAWLAGSVAFFVPAALGVREIALTALLGPMFALGWPAAFAIASRIWFSLIEVVWFALANAATGKRPRT